MPKGVYRRTVDHAMAIRRGLAERRERLADEERARLDALQSAQFILCDRKKRANLKAQEVSIGHGKGAEGHRS